MKNVILVLGLFLSLSARADGLTDRLNAASLQAQDKLDKNVGAASPLLTGTWIFTKRMCVSGFSLEAFNHPTQVMDITHYYNVMNFTGATERFTTTNADKLDNHCVSQVSGIISSVPVDLREGGLTVSEVLAIKTTQRQRINCADSYKGPSLAKVVDVIKIDNNTAYFFLLPGQLASGPANCTNPSDFNFDLAVRVPDVL